MKEKKLYKIAFMGDEDHGCDIISTLESWGGSNYYSRTGNYSEYAYFINDLGTIDFIHNSVFLSEEMKNFYFLFWHDYNIECHLKVGETINYGGQDYDVDDILFDANNRCIVYKLKSFGIGVEYITNNELIPTEEHQTEEENNEYLFKNNMEKNLAIKGHSTRGKEVIELLEMMGGKNIAYHGADINVIYTIDNKGIIRSLFFNDSVLMKMEYNIFTLEEFLEKYPFKVGDKVFLYDNITLGCVTGMEWDKDKETVKYCVYTSSECWCDVKDLLKWNTIDLAEKHYMDNMGEKDKAKALDIKIKGEDYSGKRFEYKIPDGYEFDKVENGKIILKPIKPKYPTTYEECCKVLGISYRAQLSYTYPEVEHNNVYLTKEKHLLDAFMKLRICRNAYWKIVGEQMGLGKPWDSTYGCGEWGYWIGYNINENKIYLQDSRILINHTLVFPTAEMRDAFYENFKKEIEQCNELL